MYKLGKTADLWTSGKFIIFFQNARNNAPNLKVIVVFVLNVGKPPENCKYLFCQ